jgi:hypothetical protein
MAKVSKRQQEVQQEPVSKILTIDERLKVETMPLTIENAKLKMAVEEQLLKNMILEYKLMEAQIERQRRVVGEYHHKYNQEKTLYTSTISDIMKNHNLENDKFGYNPNTGEIV